MIADTAVPKLRARITATIPTLGRPTIQASQQWWLLGTSNCHLCEVAEQLIKRLQAVVPITYQYVDIADFDEDLMMQFATVIPVVLTPTQCLNYPFSVMDLQQLL
ncbi:thioredoxin family protein [Psychrobacter sp. Cmf 22.2]|nr:thioredoxin family protein [Psychrobacter sp. Cmf 22.2]